MKLHVDYVLYPEDLPFECIADCSSVGDVSEAVEYWRRHLGFSVDRSRAIDCLCGYGSWERGDLEAMSDEDLAEKILWMACCDFREGSDLFVLE